MHTIKFELWTAALQFEANEYLFEFDVKSGYHHLDIHPNQKQFLGFKWVGIAIMYMFD